MLAFYDWLRRHPGLVDSVLALLIAGLGTGPLLAAEPVRLPRLLGLVLVACMCAPLAVRRSRPVGVFTTLIVAGGLEVLLLSRPVGSDVAVLVALYTLAAYRPRRIALPGLLVTLFGSLIAILRWTPEHAIHDWWTLGEVLAVFWGPALTAWLLGDMTRWRRSYYHELEERAARLERERDAQAQIAAAAERARIARELHDVVAHNVSVMVVQADGASYAISSSPDRAREALAAISATGRQALSEMRSLLGVLRSASDSAADDGAELAPQPGIEQLSGLLTQARATGLPVSFTVEGVPRQLPRGTALTAYRVVQESLTNARKHGGAGVTATVTLRFCEGEVAIIVTDDGTASPKEGDGQGHGLIGMRERVELFGGTVTAGPEPGGGYRVRVTLPARLAGVAA
ncbi:MAG TPA: histidine kinase [Trebonia sp.]|nr:histidine kinase [Trebonia sp.]